MVGVVSTRPVDTGHALPMYIWCNPCQARPETDRPNSNLRCWARFRLGLKSLDQTWLVTQPNWIQLFSNSVNKNITTRGQSQVGWTQKEVCLSWLEIAQNPTPPKLLKGGPCWGIHFNIGASILMCIDAYGWKKLTVVHKFAKWRFLNPMGKSQTWKSSKINEDIYCSKSSRIL